MSSVESDLASFIASMARARSVPFSKDSDLVEDGILDSVGVYEVVGFIDERYAVALPDEELTPETFRSVGALAAVVDATLSRQGRQGRDVDPGKGAADRGQSSAR